MPTEKTGQQAISATFHQTHHLTFYINSAIIFPLYENGRWQSENNPRSKYRLSNNFNSYTYPLTASVV
jgi:hypothetical protein